MKIYFIIFAAYLLALTDCALIYKDGLEKEKLLTDAMSKAVFNSQVNEDSCDKRLRRFFKNYEIKNTAEIIF